MGQTNFDEVTSGGNIVATHYPITVPLLAASVDTWVYIAPRAVQVTSIREIHSVVGSTSAAVKFRKITAATVAAPGAAVAAGITELATAGFDLTAAVNTNQTATLTSTTADLQLAAGDRIAADFSGTLTGLVGNVTINVKMI
jgi:hypothetical protein